MADEEAPGNGGGVQEIQNSGPPQPQAAAGDAKHKEAANKEEEKFLLQMRGWLMTVGTLFVTMSFQAALQPPAWLRTADFLRLSQSEIDQWNHYFHGASRAAVAPARFGPSPSPSPQAAESATAGVSTRARAYMYCNYCTFGSSLALVLSMIFLQTKPPHRAKLIVWIAKILLAEISLFVVGTVVLGTTEDWRYMMYAASAIGASALVILYPLGASAFVIVYPQILTALRKCSATFRARQAGGPSAPPSGPDHAERTSGP